MERTIDLKEISDGRLYGPNDMVKADCGDCEGCSACCRGMGTSIVLDPLDIYRMFAGLNVSFEGMIDQVIELNVVDGVILPNLKMDGDEEACVFLDDGGRCRIHAFRPGICRIFPLGRIYENNAFQYFLQVRECKKENRGKVKVKKWIDTPDVKKNEQFITDWHYYLKEQQENVKQAKDQEMIREVSLYVLREFYLRAYHTSEDFYEQFYERLKKSRTGRSTRMKGYIFDFNGTLIFDSAFNEAAWRKLVRDKGGKEISDEAFLKFVHGKSNDIILEYFFGRKFSKDEAERLGEEKEVIYRNMCLAQGENFRMADGAEEMFAKMKQRNIPYAVATSSHRPNVDFYFKTLHLERWFSHENFIYHDGTFPGKPAPDIYLRAAARIQCAPAACVVVEDAPAGILAAQNAGIPEIIGIGEGKEGRELLRREWDIPVIADYRSVDFNENGELLFAD